MPSKEQRDDYAPLTDYERHLLAKLFGATGEIPAEFWAALKSKLEIDPPKLIVSDIPSLKGEEWREVGATGQPAFGTNWSNSGGAASTCAFFRDATGIVHLKGIATKNGTPAAGDVIFTLPSGYRPALDEYFAVATGGTNTAGVLRVEADGDVMWLAGNTTEADYTSLSGISFRAI